MHSTLPGNLRSFSARLLLSNSWLLASALVVTAALSAPSAKAQMTAGQQVGVEITPGSATTNWTLVNQATSPIQALDLSTGSDISGVSVALYVDSGGINDLSGTTIGNSITDVPSSVLDNGAFGGSSLPLQLTFSGLSNSQTYTLEVFSVSNLSLSASIPDTPVINGVDTTWASGFDSRGARFGASTGAFFYNVTTDGSGNLSFAISDLTNNNPVLSAVVLTAVPEPATYAAMAGVVVLGAVLLRARRRWQALACAA